MLQFATGAINETAPTLNVEWPVRSIAASVYYAQHSYAAANGGRFTTVPDDLNEYVEDAAILDGTCTGGIPVSLVAFVDGMGSPRFSASIPPNPSGDATARASIDDTRLLRVMR